MDFSPMMVGALLLLATAIGGVAAHQKNMAYSAILKQQPSEVWSREPLCHASFLYETRYPSEPLPVSKVAVLIAYVARAAMVWKIKRYEEATDAQKDHRSGL